MANRAYTCEILRKRAFPEGKATSRVGEVQLTERRKNVSKKSVSDRTYILRLTLSWKKKRELEKGAMRSLRHTSPSQKATYGGATVAGVLWPAGRMKL